MKTICSSLLIVVIGAVTGLLNAKEAVSLYAIPQEEETGVYAKSIRGIGEKPQYTVDPSQRLEVVDSSRNLYKIKGPEEKSGWVEKKAVALQKVQKAYIFGDVDITGYLDNPTPVYILDAEGDIEAGQLLDRSFAEELRHNVTREHLEWITGQYGFAEQRL